MYKEPRVATVGDLESYLGEGYTIVGIYYTEEIVQVEDEEAECHRQYTRPTGPGQYQPHYSYSSNSSSGDMTRKVIKKNVTIKHPHFILSRDPAVKVLFGTNNL